MYFLSKTAPAPAAPTLCRYRRQSMLRLNKNRQAITCMTKRGQAARRAMLTR